MQLKIWYKHADWASGWVIAEEGFEDQPEPCAHYLTQDAPEDVVLFAIHREFAIEPDDVLTFVEPPANN